MCSSERWVLGLAALDGGHDGDFCVGWDDGVAWGVLLVDGEEEGLVPGLEVGPVLVELLEEVVEGGVGGEGPVEFCGVGDVAEEGEEEDGDGVLGHVGWILDGWRTPMQGRWRYWPW